MAPALVTHMVIAMPLNGPTTRRASTIIKPFTKIKAVERIVASAPVRSASFPLRSVVISKLCYETQLSADY